MTGWPDEHVACHRAGGLCTGRARQGCLQHLRKGEARRRQIGHERRAQVWECVVGKTEMRIWVVGLDAARKTTMRYNWKLDEFVATILITGINVESLGTRLRQDLAHVTPRLPGNRRSGPRRRQQQSNGAMLADDRTWTAAGCSDARLLGRDAGDEWVAGQTE